MIYPVFLEKSADGYCVGVPDVLGCVSAGDTIEEALANAREAIIFHLEGMAEDGQEPPPPRPVEVHRRNPDWKTADLWSVVEVPDRDLPGRAVRLNITLNERLLARVDAAAHAMGETRSGLLQRGATELLDRRAGLTPPAGSKRPKAAAGRTTAKGRRAARRG